MYAIRGVVRADGNTGRPSHAAHGSGAAGKLYLQALGAWRA
jgi:hypothetical protein